MYKNQLKIEFHLEIILMIKAILKIFRDICIKKVHMYFKDGKYLIILMM